MRLLTRLGYGTINEPYYLLLILLKYFMFYLYLLSGSCQTCTRVFSQTRTCGSGRVGRGSAGGPGNVIKACSGPGGRGGRKKKMHNENKLDRVLEGSTDKSQSGMLNIPVAATHVKIAKTQNHAMPMVSFLLGPNLWTGSI